MNTRIDGFLDDFPYLLSDKIKQHIREALFHALSCDVFGEHKTVMCRNIVADFYHSLNRHRVLQNEEVQKEIDSLTDTIDWDAFEIP